MIVRIVKMHFRKENISQFKEVFEASKQKIRNFPGVLHLELLEDSTESGILFTYSYWESEEALEKYRRSELFLNTWSKTKPLFESPAQAWSNKRIAYLP